MGNWVRQLDGSWTNSEGGRLMEYAPGSWVDQWGDQYVKQGDNMILVNSNQLRSGPPGGSQTHSTYIPTRKSNLAREIARSRYEGDGRDTMTKSRAIAMIAISAWIMFSVVGIVGIVIAICFLGMMR